MIPDVNHFALPASPKLSRRVSPAGDAYEGAASVLIDGLMNQKVGCDCKRDPGAGVVRGTATSAASVKALFRELQERDEGCVYGQR